MSLPSSFSEESVEGHRAVFEIASNGTLLQRLQPGSGYVGYISGHLGHMSAMPKPLPLPSSSSPSPSPSLLPSPGPLPISTIATPSPTTVKTSNMTTVLSYFLPTAASMPTLYSKSSGQTATISASDITPVFSTHAPPNTANLVASSAEDLSNFRDFSFDIFDDNDDLFGSPLAFDASENGLWNGRFVPPPPRPPFLIEDAVLSDGLTTCDLCSWAMPTKTTFIFEGTIEKASELGWPLTLIIVSVLSALLGAIIMVTVIRCRRKKATNNRNASHVQWWSRNKRPSSNNNNHLRRSNIYTAHPADSIRGLQQSSLSAASSLTAIIATGVSNATNTTIEAAASQFHQYQHQQHQQHEIEQDFSEQQHEKFNTQNHLHLPSQSRRTQAAPSYMHNHYHHHIPLHYQEHQHQHQHQNQNQNQHQQHRPQYLFSQNQKEDFNVFDHEYHLPQELHLHHRQLSSSLSTSTSASSSSPSPSLTLNSSAIMPAISQHMQLQHQPQQHSQQFFQDNAKEATATTATSCHWPNTAMLLAS